jgi:hypothetical protein
LRLISSTSQAIWSIVWPSGAGQERHCRAIDRSEIAVRIGPFVPDGDAVLLQIADIGVAAQEPDQLVDDRFQVQLLGRDQRKALGEVEAHLVAEHRERAGAGAVVLADAVSSTRCRRS